MMWGEWSYVKDHPKILRRPQLLFVRREIGDSPLPGQTGRCPLE